MTTYRQTITRRFQYAMGHTLHQHEGACANLHGHNYIALVTVGSDDLDSVGRVIDFSVVKERVGLWIDRNYDHRFLVNRQDPRASKLVAIDKTVRQVDFNPTAENLAHELMLASKVALATTGIDVLSITLWETENAYATV
jgi:6-pyruvoyltetrahydropterin/6-carboxytetrahydropterin synthase